MIYTKNIQLLQIDIFQCLSPIFNFYSMKNAIFPGQHKIQWFFHSKIQTPWPFQACMNHVYNRWGVSSQLWKLEKNEERRILLKYPPPRRQQFPSMYDILLPRGESNLTTQSECTFITLLCHSRYTREHQLRYKLHLFHNSALQTHRGNITQGQ